ncbi:multi-sensor hybrid histidine kinase [Stylonychia lemnae]|uniref:Multi-sensor hybrid histidine kinase n=1 Tax=Stylonychia lemnae TaxID=5949 RepID=A0A077ZPZ3_STYLE|nr:multi-sensor hybrid histidine kinase [Stylonychia lemnae]|eukprot:CDW71973.1 multi-sensor hybrid histidine kinase [Stylonychia lemnae]
MNKYFTENEYIEQRCTAYINHFNVHFKLIFLLTATLLCFECYCGKKAENQLLVGSITFGFLYAWNQFVKRQPIKASEFESFVWQPSSIVQVFMVTREINENIGIFHPALISQSTFTIIGLINSPQDWFPKTISFFFSLAIQSFLYLYFYGQNGVNVPLLEVPIYILFTSLIMGVVLRRSEIFHREELNRKKAEVYQRDKFVNVLQLIQDGVLIIKSDQDDTSIVFQNESFLNKIKDYNQKLLAIQDPKRSASLNKINSQDKQIAQNHMIDHFVDKFQELDDKILSHIKYNRLDQIFKGLIFRHEFTSNENVRYTFSQFLEIIRTNKDDKELKEYYFKVEPINISLHINVNNLIQESQILIVFKEVSTYKKLQKTKHREKFTNIFINSTAHNIFTPINGLIGILQLIQQECQRFPTAGKYILLMRTCIFNLYYTTQNILEHSKIRLKQFTPDLKPEYLKSIINDLVNLFHQDALQKQIKIQLDLQIDDGYYMIDQQRLCLVLFNLISNSIKFTDFGNIIVTCQILSKFELFNKFQRLFTENQQLFSHLKNARFNQEILMSEDEAFYYISIEDSGQGMQNYNQEELFNLFQKLKISSDNINQQGLGLGLSVSSQICLALGGKLQLEQTKRGLGSRFSFYLPLKEQQQITESEQLEILMSNDDEFQNEFEITDTNRSQGSAVTKRDYIQVLNETASKNLNFNVILSPRLLSDRIVETGQINYDTERISEEQKRNNPTYPQILIVDDTVFNVEILSIILKDMFKLESDKAFCGNQAIKMIQERAELQDMDNRVQMYKFILMDINMPGMDGVQATKTIREQFSYYFQDNLQKIYAYTAIPENQLGNLQQCGFNGYLPKPLSYLLLEEVLRDIQILK